MAEQQLERSMLDGKDREQLHAIAGAMGIKGVTRLRKADLVDAILGAATGGGANGDTNGDANGDSAAKPLKAARAAKASKATSKRTASPESTDVRPSPPRHRHRRPESRSGRSERPSSPTTTAISRRLPPRRTPSVAATSRRSHRGRCVATPRAAGRRARPVQLLPPRPNRSPKRSPTHVRREWRHEDRDRPRTAPRPRAAARTTMPEHARRASIPTTNARPSAKATDPVGAAGAAVVTARERRRKQ